MVTNPVEFYVNCIGPEGVFSVCRECLSDTQDTRTYFVRGGIGESSDFISDVSTTLEKEGLFCQRFLSFYGEKYLDGAYFPDVDVYIFDGNFVRCPVSLPDCRHYTIDLGVAARKKELFLSKVLISQAMEEERRYLKKTEKFLSTINSIKEDTLKLSCDAVNTDKVERFVSRFIKRELGTSSSFTGREYFRLLTAFTPEGIKFPENTLVRMCPKLYCIDDKTGTVSGSIISQIRESAMLCGFDVVSLLSPFGKGNKAEHIIVPEIGLGIITSNNFHRYEGECFKRVSATRFLDSEKMKKHKSGINFNLTAEKELSGQAFYLLGEARKCREEYSEIYSRSYDKEKIQSLEKETVKEILSYISCT